MTKHEKQRLVDEISRKAAILNKEGEDVVKIFDCIREINRNLVLGGNNE